MIQLRYLFNYRYPDLPLLQWRRRVWWKLFAWSDWEYVQAVEDKKEGGTFRPSLVRT